MAIVPSSCRTSTNVIANTMPNAAMGERNFFFIGWTVGYLVTVGAKGAPLRYEVLS